jgi:hypothetical protein
MNVPYHSARMEGKFTRAFYRAALPMIARRELKIKQEIPLNVFSYSGENTLPEQVASIRSFLVHAGRPKKFTVVSDGSYSSASVELLEKIDNCVRVQKTPPPLPPGLPDKIQAYLTSHETGKQLALIMSLPENGPTLYTDSDVLFFPGATVLEQLASTTTAPALYLADHRFSGDERLIVSEDEKRNPVNTGFLLLFRKLDWSLGLERLASLSGPPNFFTNQTIAHLCLNANGARPLDPEKFVLRNEDEFGYADHYANGSLAVRHYVNPIRHKFWAALAHQFLR